MRWLTSCGSATRITPGFSTPTGSPLAEPTGKEYTADSCLRSEPQKNYSTKSLTRALLGQIIRHPHAAEIIPNPKSGSILMRHRAPGSLDSNLHLRESRVRNGLATNSC